MTEHTLAICWWPYYLSILTALPSASFGGMDNASMDSPPASRLSYAHTNMLAMQLR